MRVTQASAALRVEEERTAELRRKLGAEEALTAELRARLTKAISRTAKLDEAANASRALRADLEHAQATAKRVDAAATQTRAELAELRADGAEQTAKLGALRVAAAKNAEELAKLRANEVELRAELKVLRVEREESSAARALLQASLHAAQQSAHEAALNAAAAQQRDATERAAAADAAAAEIAAAQAATAQATAAAAAAAAVDLDETLEARFAELASDHARQAAELVQQGELLARLRADARAREALLQDAEATAARDSDAGLRERYDALVRAHATQASELERLAEQTNEREAIAKELMARHEQTLRHLTEASEMVVVMDRAVKQRERAIAVADELASAVKAELTRVATLLTKCAAMEAARGAAHHAELAARTVEASVLHIVRDALAHPQHRGGSGALTIEAADGSIRTLPPLGPQASLPSATPIGAHGELINFYRYIACESCSHFDSLPRTHL